MNFSDRISARLPASSPVSTGIVLVPCTMEKSLFSLREFLRTDESSEYDTSYNVIICGSAMKRASVLTETSSMWTPGSSSLTAPRRPRSPSTSRRGSDAGLILATRGASLSANTASKIFPETSNPYTAEGYFSETASAITVLTSSKASISSQLT